MDNVTKTQINKLKESLIYSFYEENPNIDYRVAGHSIENAKGKNLDFTKTVFSRNMFVDSVLSNVKTKDTLFDECVINNLTIKNSTINTLTISNSDITKLTFYNCIIEELILLKHKENNDINFVKCEIYETDFRHKNLYGWGFNDCLFNTVYFDRSILNGVKFIDVYSQYATYEECVYNQGTVFPEDVDPEAHNMIYATKDLEAWRYIGCESYFEQNHKRFIREGKLKLKLDEKRSCKKA